jgi:hypothetical protein
LGTLEGILDITCSRTCAIDPRFQMGMIMIGAIPEYKWGLQYLVWDCNILSCYAMKIAVSLGVAMYQNCSIVECCDVHHTPHQHTTHE